MKGTIFNIQHFSLHDGPGIRTTVFFKGCPLRCIWCHNPESFKPEQQVVFDENKCLKCGSCKDVRNEAAAEKCPSGAMEVIGKNLSVEDLMKEILKDKDYFETSGGGVTFSGGEPLMQPEFLQAVLKKCKKLGIHTAVDTCGYADRENFELIGDLTDLYLFDIKLINDELHKKYTGVSNSRILENLKFISESGKRIFIRIPLVPGITDTDDNISGIREFLRSIKFEQVNLLSYHGLAKNKYIKLGLESSGCDIKGQEVKTDDIKRIFENEGCKVVTGG